VCVLVELTRPARIEPPPPAELPVAATFETPEPSHVPQHPDNLWNIEDSRNSDDPVLRDLANGRFKYGGKMADVLAVHTPDLLLQHGDYTTALYAAGNRQNWRYQVLVTALNGKLVRSARLACHRDAIFFNGLSDEQERAWHRGYYHAFDAIFDIPRAPEPIPDPIPPPREVKKPTP
jgi:hypothetical protein